MVFNCRNILVLLVGLCTYQKVIHILFTDRMRVFLKALTAIFLGLSTLDGATAQTKIRPRLSQNLYQLQADLSSVFAGSDAMRHVVYLQKFWRESGNADYNAAMDYIAAELQRAGFAEMDTVFQLAIEQRKIPGTPAWQPHGAELQLISPIDTVLHSLAMTKMMLCINSHATPAPGVAAPLVPVDALGEIPPGSLSGKIAYTHQHPARVYETAVLRGGAAGIVSSSIPALNQPEEFKDSINMSSIPYRRTPQTFGMKISTRSRVFLDSLLQKNTVMVRVKIDAEFMPKNVKGVQAIIRGAAVPEQQVVLVAHVDEPGANDNASGAAALLETAIALQKLVASGRIPRPQRSIRLMWVEEIRALQRLRKVQPAFFENTTAALIMDMVGEDVRLTGGTFLIERTPDPAMLWTRPPDQHTEWGTGTFPREKMTGTYLNDFVALACSVRAGISNWSFRTNPFEGGSDHVPFLQQGVPAVLGWHFTDVFYHTSGDDIDKVSPDEMANVAISFASAALLLASCSTDDALDMLAILSQKARWRLENEYRNSLAALQSTGKRSGNVDLEREIHRAWQKWYLQSFESVEGLPIHSADDNLRHQIAQHKSRLLKFHRQILDGLPHGAEASENSRR